MFRFGVFILVAMLAVALAPQRAAAQTQQQACATYASRAVQQYESMASHPACHVPDDLRWQNSYQNHFAGCMAAPQLTASETAARDDHLRACGALATAPAAAETHANLTGNWTDTTGGSGVWQIQLGATSDDLVAFLPARTGTFPGRVTGSNQLFINFAFLGPGCCTATLSADGQSLLWSNGAIWRR